MGMPSSQLGFAVLMTFAGVGIPIMAALNSGLGMRVGNPWAATFILFVVGGVASGALLAINGLPKAPFGAPPVFYAGGLLVAFYALSVTWAAPRIGVGNAVFFVLLGQIVAATAIDHFGLFGAVRSAITAQRAAGIAFMLVGVFLARRVA
ncbi:MAG TPA: DMT family transporter [Caulobacterales bacterium]|jgi:transporter family-2 protein|nr:DMT family transporter [Caulobacterales bacterium]